MVDSVLYRRDIQETLALKIMKTKKAKQCLKDLIKLNPNCIISWNDTNDVVMLNYEDYTITINNHV